MTESEKNADQIAKQEEAQRQRQEMFFKYNEEISKRTLTNSEQQDRHVITLSSAAIGFSMVVLKEFPKEWRQFNYLLSIALISLVVSIALVISSYIVSQLELEKQLEIARKYYLENDEDALKAERKNAITKYINIFSGSSFVAGMLFLALFTYKTFSLENNMTDQKRKNYSNTITMQGPPKREHGAVPPPRIPPVQSPTQGPSNNPPPEKTNK
ncbi:hypothetical protein [Pseudogulbenkiania ferrooxidans]|uniref:hypothetical protein n=1 Tax=Pseudogulbenkiania ferrooxidans TaxID=549169 RepID=UPI001268D639|nr:hypothetical protein [Pseudogulbenkiania ferrooxidans]